MRLRMLAVVLFGLLLRPVAAQDNITLRHDGPRALDRIAGQLIQRFGYLIHYEEAAYAERDLIFDRLPDGRQNRYPRSSPMTFSMPAHASFPDRGVRDRRAGLPSLEETVTRLIAEHHKTGNPGQFSVRFENGYAHIIQTGRRTEPGALEAVEPLLDAVIPTTAGPQSCLAAMREFQLQLAIAKQVRVVEGRHAMNRLMTKSCTIVGSPLSAREILGQILTQMGDNGPHFPPTRLLYDLEHEANWNVYFLSTFGAPAAIGRPFVPAGRR